MMYHEHIPFAKQPHETACQLRTNNFLCCSFAGVRQHITVPQQPNLNVGLWLYDKTCWDDPPNSPNSLLYLS